MQAVLAHSYPFGKLLARLCFSIIPFKYWLRTTEAWCYLSCIRPDKREFVLFMVHKTLLKASWIEIYLIELIQLHPFHLLLALVWMGSVFWLIIFKQLTFKEEFHLPKLQIRTREMVFRYIFTHMQQSSDLDLCANLVGNFTNQCFTQVFRLLLTATGQDTKATISILFSMTRSFPFWMMTAFAELRSFFLFHIDSALILLFSFSAGDCQEYQGKPRF